MEPRQLGPAARGGQGRGGGKQRGAGPAMAMTTPRSGAVAAMASDRTAVESMGEGRGDDRGDGGGRFSLPHEARAWSATNGRVRADARQTREGRQRAGKRGTPRTQQKNGAMRRGMRRTAAHSIMLAHTVFSVCRGTTVRVDGVVLRSSESSALQGFGELWLTPSAEAKLLDIEAGVSWAYAVGSKSTYTSSEAPQNRLKAAGRSC